ncbi:nitrogen fixation protein NifX, partial [Klebsiella variicola]
MPPINRQFDMVHADEWSMKVAFASSDYRHVDQHFGATPRLVVYGVKADRVTLLRVVEFPVASGHQTEKIAERIHALEDCVTLFCV